MELLIVEFKKLFWAAWFYVVLPFAVPGIVIGWLVSTFYVIERLIHADFEAAAFVSMCGFCLAVTTNVVRVITLKGLNQ